MIWKNAMHRMVEGQMWLNLHLLQISHNLIGSFRRGVSSLLTNQVLVRLLFETANVGHIKILLKCVVTCTVKYNYL